MLIFLFLSSCDNVKKNVSEKQGIKARIKEVQINHVVEKRKGCRFTKMVFVINIENTSLENQTLKFTPRPDHCEREVETSQLHWLINGEEKQLVTVSLKDSVVELRPDESREIRLKVLFNVIGRNLKEIEAHYTPWFEAPFEITYLYKGEKLMIKKSNNFAIKLFLDDTLVTDEDSIKYNLSLGGFSTSIDTLNINPPIVEEIELDD
jgi:hypothetical protein